MIREIKSLTWYSKVEKQTKKNMEMAKIQVKIR